MPDPKELVWNPLKRFPRNSPCFCGSDKKAKKCCMPNLAPRLFYKDQQTILRVWDGLLNGTEVLEFRRAVNPQAIEQAIADVVQ